MTAKSSRSISAPSHDSLDDESTLHSLPVALPATAPVLVSRTCPVCGGTPRSSRSVYCEKAACKQRAYRLRHQPLTTIDLHHLRRDLQRRRTLVAHTIYECSSCGERALGERRCQECGLFGRAVGLGGVCQGCDETILLTELLELE